MYLGIDIGGTKTIVACMNSDGAIQESFKFATPKLYASFLKELANTVDKLSTKKFTAAGAAFPGKLDRIQGMAIAFGNRSWHDLPVQKDLEKILRCSVMIENDANLGGLSEAMLLKDYRKVLYVTISTGIGTGFIVDKKIDPDMEDSEGGNILLEHNGKLEAWEDFASGRAIVNNFGKRASEIDDEQTWQLIAHNIAIGLIDLIAIMQPEVIVIGGSVGTYFKRFDKYLTQYMKEYENPLFTVPVMKEAARPDLAVVYGCFDLVRAKYGSIA